MTYCCGHRYRLYMKSIELKGGYVVEQVLTLAKDGGRGAQPMGGCGLHLERGFKAEERLLDMVGCIESLSSQCCCSLLQQREVLRLRPGCLFQQCLRAI